MLFSIAQNLTVSGVTVLISNRIHEFLAHLTATLKIAIDYLYRNPVLKALCLSDRQFQTTKSSLRFARMKALVLVFINFSYESSGQH